MKQFTLTIFLFLGTALTTFGQDAYLDKGNSYLNNGQLDKAEQTFRDGIQSDSTKLIYQCQLGLALMQEKKYAEAEQVLDQVLKKDPNNIAATWYSGIDHFYNAQDRQAIKRFEKALTFLDKQSGQYYSANWFIGKCYSNLLKTDGLTYAEADRMFECYEVYIKLQPNAEDTEQVKKYVEEKTLDEEETDSYFDSQQ